MTQGAVLLKKGPSPAGIIGLGGVSIVLAGLGLRFQQGFGRSAQKRDDSESHRKQKAGPEVKKAFHKSHFGLIKPQFSTHDEHDKDRPIWRNLEGGARSAFWFLAGKSLSEGRRL